MCVHVYIDVPTDVPTGCVHIDVQARCVYIDMPARCVYIDVPARCVYTCTYMCRLGVCT